MTDWLNEIKKFNDKAINTSKKPIKKIQESKKMNPNKIIDYCHKQGIKFTFDKDCMVQGCKKLSKWEQDITHQQEGKITLHLCQKHMNDFDKNIVFKIEVQKK